MIIKAQQRIVHKMYKFQKGWQSLFLYPEQKANKSTDIPMKAMYRRVQRRTDVGAKGALHTAASARTSTNAPRQGKAPLSFWESRPPSQRNAVDER